MNIEVKKGEIIMKMNPTELRSLMAFIATTDVGKDLCDCPPCQRLRVMLPIIEHADELNGEVNKEELDKFTQACS